MLPLALPWCADSLSVGVVVHEDVAGLGAAGQEQRRLGPGHARHRVSERRDHLLLLTLPTPDRC